jgi:hypothetical protein
MYSIKKMKVVLKRTRDMQGELEDNKDINGSLKKETCLKLDR